MPAPQIMESEKSMTGLQDILKDLDQPLYHRIDKALELMNRQALGSERFREDVKVWTKDDRTPVSVADLLHQSQVQQMIAENFPDDGLVCEEPETLQAEVIEEASAASQTYYDLPLQPKLIVLPETGKNDMDARSYRRNQGISGRTPLCDCAGAVCRGEAGIRSDGGTNRT